MIKASNPAGVEQDNYPRHAWWVAARGDEISSKPLQRWILQQPVVLYRGVSGRVIALDDRCPHRWSPLSLGKVTGDDIVCGYHGFQFGPSGQCNKIPSQKSTPSSVRVRSYPVKEIGPFVWIYTGDPQTVDESAMPKDLSVFNDPERVTTFGYMEVGCNFLALQENVLDLSHFSYALAATIGGDDNLRPGKLAKTADTVAFVQSFEATPLPARYGIPTGIGCERPVDRVLTGTFYPPGLHWAILNIKDGNHPGGSTKHFDLQVVHATTPIDRERCHYWWFYSQSYGGGEGVKESLTARLERVFSEDQRILEATQAMVRRDARAGNYIEVSVACDLAAVEARRMVDNMSLKAPPAVDSL